MRTTYCLLVVAIGLILVGCSSPAESTTAAKRLTSDGPAANVGSSGSRGGLLGGWLTSGSPASSTKPAPASPNLYEKLLFHPTKFPAGDWQPAELTFESIDFTSADDTRLHGWFCPCESPRAVVLYAHGNAGNLSYDVDLLRRLQKELRVATFAFDYRGYGKSEGEPTVAGILDDASSARTWLAKRTGMAESQITLMGRSLGGAVVVQLAAETHPRGLILESTFSSLKEAAAHHFPKLAWLVPKDELNSAAKMLSYHGPLLLSHGDADQTIPFAQSEALYETQTHPKQWGTKHFFRIPGGDHNDPQPPEYYRQLDRFFGELP